jgi:uncharacterized membrane protein
MRKLVRSSIAITLSLLLALFSAALTYSAPISLQGNFPAAGFLQTTPTPQQSGSSEIGSTDGIVILGGVITFIIILPIILRRKAWMQE